MECSICHNTFEWDPGELTDDEIDELLNGLQEEGDDVSKGKRGSRRGKKKKPTAPMISTGIHSPSLDWNRVPEQTWEPFTGSIGGGHGYKTCHHVMDKVVLRDEGLNEEVAIYCSAGSKQHTRQPDQIPDFGLYADKIWSSVCRNEYINWPDYGVPKDAEVARQQIIDAFIRACNGERVEIGCIGGHGRTGTLLACMVVLAGYEPTAAIDYVRSQYCHHAVETQGQEEWVKWFHDECFGEAT